MSIVKYNSLPIAERRKNDIQSAKISLVEEQSSTDEAIQNEIRKEYSLSQELSILRKEVKELKSAVVALSGAESASEDAPTSEFDEYNSYVEKCKKTVKEAQNEERFDYRTE